MFYVKSSYYLLATLLHVTYSSINYGLLEVFCSVEMITIRDVQGSVYRITKNLWAMNYEHEVLFSEDFAKKGTLISAKVFAET